LEVGLAFDRYHAGRGPISSLLNANAPIPNRHARYANLAPGIRRAIYRQYDALIVLLLLLAALEHVVRSRLEFMRIPHRRQSDNRPYSIVQFLNGLGLPSYLNDPIEDLYSAVGSNIRNRVAHSGYFVVDACRPHIVDQFLRQGQYHPAWFYPETLADGVASIVGELLVLWHNGLDFNWTRDEVLEAQDVALLDALPSELDTDDVLEHQQQFRLFVDNVAPTFSALAKDSVIMTVRQPPIEQLGALFLVFEGIFRATCDLIGSPTIQVMTTGTGADIHNSMLDEEGLLRAPVLRPLLEVLPDKQRDDARSVLSIITGARNRLMHGAVFSIGEDHRRRLGRAMVKVTYWLGTVGLQHMIRERAYFRWRTGPGAEASAEENWLSAEKDFLQELHLRIEAMNAIAKP